MDHDLVIRTADSPATSSDKRLERKLRDLDLDHRMRQAAIQGHQETGQHAQEAMVGLADFGHEQYTMGTESMVRRFRATTDDPMVREPLDDFTRRQIAETGRHVRATVDGASRRMVEQVTRPYDTKVPERSLMDKLRGR